MNRILAFLVLFSVAVCAPAQSPTSGKPACAILTFDARTGVTPGEAALLSDRFASEFEDIGKFQVIARSKMKEILDMQAFQYSDACSAAECAIEAGRLLSARYMVYGSIGQIDSLFTINSYLIDVETGGHVRKATTDLICTQKEALTILMKVNVYQMLGLESPPLPAGLAARQNAEYNQPVLATPSAPTEPPMLQLHSSSPRAQRAIHVSPRIGVSTSSGILGLELQLANFAISAGIVPYGFAAGARFYLNPDQNSWFFGGSGLQLELEGEEVKGEANVDKTTYTSFGGMVGYRWLSPEGWLLSFGLGLGVVQEEEEYVMNDDQEEAPEDVFGPIGELVVGYAF